MFYPISRFISRGLLKAEVGLRAIGLALTIFISFLLLAPIQWANLRLKPRFGWVLPRLFYGIVLRLVKVRVKVSGSVPRNMPEGMAALVVTNHVSWTDIFALGALFPAAFVAKSEVSRWPIIRTFARLVNTIFVDRNARTSIPATNAAMLAHIKAGEHVVLFPEATTYADGPQPFHSSHFAIAKELFKLGPGYAIQPIAIHYSAAHAAWIGDDALLPHVLRLMRNPPVTCELIFCELLPLDGPQPRRAVAQACYERIVAAYDSAASVITPPPARAS
ncbi:MAG: lysophospholipid acyltransferase family protein [Methylovirgula sp.]